MADPIIFSDIDATFEPNPLTGDIGRLTNEQAIKKAIVNLVNTNIYERPFRPFLYGGVRNELFEPMTRMTASTIQRQIKSLISTYEPRVAEVAVEVTPISTENGYDIVIRFQPIKSITRTAVKFFLKRAI